MSNLSGTFVSKAGVVGPGRISLSAWGTVVKELNLLLLSAFSLSCQENQETQGKGMCL